MAVVLRSSPDLSTNSASFDEIARWHLHCLNAHSEDISIDLSAVRWIDAHLSSAILCVIRKMQLRGNRVVFTNASPRITDIMTRNGLFQSDKKTDSGTVIPLTSFGKAEGIQYSNFIRQHMRRMKFPQMTDALRGKIYEGLDEVFINASIHSHLDTEIFTCGQFFPKYDRIDFSITDGGIGIRGAYMRTFGTNITAAAAIDWAMADGNTTRIGDIPGGLGLKILRQFINLNQGRFIVVTGNAFWTEQNGVTDRKQMASDFPGTVVTIEVNTGDTKTYELAKAPDPLNLW
ncbi:STAS domain-containing protein [Neorhizobium sp. T7_12]|uniref:STAS domain-containing protein n=1 Tax=Neorhizobium sp. T7_12 TaxID=2093832 RepID=UPI00155EB70E|nr:STAS domain-containing protein [Neorhizobium sp. T7_12]